MRASYDLDKIKFATDPGTYVKAVDLYESGKVTKFKEYDFGCSAIVLGTRPYDVFVSSKHYQKGSCNCYLGERDALCKHMVAVALYSILSGKKLTAKEKDPISEPKCSGDLREISKEELEDINKSISLASKYIKPYKGPSKIWFAYQNSLSEGCARLSKIVSELPVNEETAKLLVGILIRLDKKLTTGGVDDSDGTVGGFIQEAVFILVEYANLNSMCAKSFGELRGKETCFGWEDPLLKIFEDNSKN
jgi:hypothetical protein